MEKYTGLDFQGFKTGQLYFNHIFDLPLQYKSSLMAYNRINRNGRYFSFSVIADAMEKLQSNLMEDRSLITDIRSYAESKLCKFYNMYVRYPIKIIPGIGTMLSSTKYSILCPSLEVFKKDIEFDYKKYKEDRTIALYGYQLNGINKISRYFSNKGSIIIEGERTK